MFETRAYHEFIDNIAYSMLQDSRLYHITLTKEQADEYHQRVRDKFVYFFTLAERNVFWYHVIYKLLTYTTNREFVRNVEKSMVTKRELAEYDKVNRREVINCALDVDEQKSLTTNIDKLIQTSLTHFDESTIRPPFLSELARIKEALEYLDIKRRTNASKKE